MAARLALVLFALLILAAPASAVSIDWVTVGNPGNACEVQSQGCFGSVSYTFQISKYEVTNAQYAELLNAKAAIDTFELYNTQMGSNQYGGITRSGSPGTYSYAAKPGREDMPVSFIGFYDALRFANWLHNGQGGGDTETGAYTLLGGTPRPSNGATVTRNSGAIVFMTSEDEWYKAAYHNTVGLSATDYFDYPAGSDMQTTCTPPTATPNTANCHHGDDFSDVGRYGGSASPYGTFDQGGNAWEWTEAIIGSVRVIRGGAFMNFDGAEALAASHRRAESQTGSGFVSMGFRVAMIPEPGTGLLLLTGLAGLAWHRRRR